MAAKRHIRNVTSDVVCITPAIAAEWLRANTGNFRRIDMSRVNCYAADIKAGLWDLNGETIVFGADGELKNGQHRLTAIIKADSSIQSVVVRGITCSAAHIDRGKPRSVAQWIAHGGVRNAPMVAAIARLCVGYAKGLWPLQGWGIDTMTDNEVLEFAEAHHEGINASLTGTRLKGVRSSNLVAVMFVGCNLADINKSETARWFRDGLVTGSDLDQNDAVLHLRNRILQASKSAHAAITPFMTRMLLTMAWNKTVAGVECSASGLRLRMTGPCKQKLPDTIGQVTDC